MKRRSVVLWTVAVAITLTSAAWQRRTGPTYPVDGEVSLGERRVALQLERSHGGEGDQPVRIRVEDAEVTAELAWRRFPTSEPWSVIPMIREREWLAASLPHQPPAGKLEYQVRLTRGAERRVFPPRPAVTRFKGHVPVGILAPHIALMFVGMLLSTRAGLEAVVPGGRPRRLAQVTLACIGVGGLILGPLVQKAAFGALWTGIPFGYDLTDNKTLILGLAWAWAVWRARGDRPARWDVLAAAAITLAVFVIPHSTWGSQLKWDGGQSLILAWRAGRPFRRRLSSSPQARIKL
jgi:hypothetical protein